MSARLDALRSQIDRGTYSVDLDKLASKIVGDDAARTGRS